MPDLGTSFDVLHIPTNSYSIGDDSIPCAGPRHERHLNAPVWILSRPVDWSLLEAVLVSGGFAHLSIDVSIDKMVGTLLAHSLEMGREIPWQRLDPRQIAITGFDWFRASAFAQFCNARLPTEIEWEIAIQSLSPKQRKEIDFSGFLQEWTSDSYAPKYWRADFAKRGVPWRDGQDVSVRGSLPNDLHKHLCVRRGCPPNETNLRRGFRLAWDIPPVGAVVVN